MLLITVVMNYILFSLEKNYSLESDEISNKSLFTVLVLLYPLIDLLRVFTLRIIKGGSPFKADQNHIHHFFFKNLIPQ